MIFPLTSFPVRSNIGIYAYFIITDVLKIFYLYINLHLIAYLSDSKVCAIIRLL